MGKHESHPRARSNNPRTQSVTLAASSHQADLQALTHQGRNGIILGTIATEHAPNRTQPQLSSGMETTGPNR